MKVTLHYCAKKNKFINYSTDSEYSVESIRTLRAAGFDFEIIYETLL